MAKTHVKGLLTNPYTISLRLDGKTHQLVRKAAEENFRSTAAEINFRLRKSLERETDKARPA
jgi:hypothetical protein